MTVHIGANLKAFLDHRAPDARYASFDYCFNHFQTAREAGETDRLADEDRLRQLLPAARLLPRKLGHDARPWRNSTRGVSETLSPL